MLHAKYSAYYWDDDGVIGINNTNLIAKAAGTYYIMSQGGMSVVTASAGDILRARYCGDGIVGIGFKRE